MRWGHQWCRMHCVGADKLVWGCVVGSSQWDSGPPTSPMLGGTRPCSLIDDGYAYLCVLYSNGNDY